MKFQKNILLKNYTTFKIGGRARYFFTAKTKAGLIGAVREAKKMNLPFFILGGGSNLLVSDKGYGGLVIKILFSKCSFLNSCAKAEAGAMLGQLVNKASKAGLTGLEWAAGIPGTVGGAVSGNAGAFGTSIGDIIKSVEVFDIHKGSVINLNSKACQFSYRSSIFKKNKDLIILSCLFQLKKAREEEIKEKIQKCLDYRRTHHPKEPSAGSIFKNINTKELAADFFKRFPEAERIVKGNQLPVAYLIDQAGLKGKQIGGAKVSEIHANFIVNTDGAKSKDIVSLISLIKKTVEEKFGVKLAEEIIFL